MATDFKIGAQVELLLKDAPKMIIVDSEDDSYGRKMFICAWFDKISNDFKTKAFLPEALIPS